MNLGLTKWAAEKQLKSENDSMIKCSQIEDSFQVKTKCFFVQNPKFSDVDRFCPRIGQWGGYDVGRYMDQRIATYRRLSWYIIDVFGQPWDFTECLLNWDHIEAVLSLVVKDKCMQVLPEKNDKFPSGFKYTNKPNTRLRNEFFRVDIASVKPHCKLFIY